MRRLPCRLLLVLTAAISAAHAASAQSFGDGYGSPAVGLGPIIERSQAPPSLLRLTPLPLAPVILPERAWMIGSVVDWNNYFDVPDDGRYVIDAETARITFGAAVGLGHDLDLSLGVPVSYRGGGTLDSFIEHFEKLLNSLNESRLTAPRNRYLVRVVANDGTVSELDDSDSGWGLEDPTISLRWQLAKGSERTPAIALSGGVKIPVADRAALRSSGGVDVDFGVALGQKMGRFNLYASLSGMRYATTEIAGVDMEQFQWSLFGGLEYRSTPRSSWLLQTVATSPAAKSFGGFSDPTYEVTIGYKRVIGTNLMIEASVLENILVFDNSPDVGFHVGVIRYVGAR